MQRSAYSNFSQTYPQNDTLFDTNYTRATHPSQPSDTWFTQQRAYSRSILASWGLPLGELPYSQDNQQTLRAVVQLIGFRQKQIGFRAKVKEDMAVLNFQKEKYRSFMEQNQRSLQEVTKKLGRIENESLQLKTKNKKNESRIRKERQDDKKMITMLRAKNQQILHEIKKKEQEVNRVKQQMKKSVGEKSATHTKNSFQVFQGLSPLKRQPSKQEESKYALLLERNEREMTDLVRQNGMLRDKLFELREHLLDFNQWIDCQLYGEVDPVQQIKRAQRFPLNHNLLFKKQSLVDEFAQLLDVAKDGIKQLRELTRGGALLGQKRTRSSQCIPHQEIETQPDFKKKYSRQELKTERPRQSEPLDVKRSKNKNVGCIQRTDQMFSGNVTPRSKKVLSPRAQKSPKNFKTFTQNLEPKQWDKGLKQNHTVSQQQIPFDDVLLSDVVEINQDSSIVSHIQVEKLGKNKFDKWDILYQDDE